MAFSTVLGPAFFVYQVVQLLHAAGKILINDLEFELNEFVQIHGVFDWIYDLKAQRVGLDAINLWFDNFPPGFESIWWLSP